MNIQHHTNPAVEGTFVDLRGERYYKISQVDQMAPFFISVVSANDHWLFVSSTGCLSAGRIRPENALFPYKSVDHIHENSENTGPKTLIRIMSDSGLALWEPYNRHHDGRYKTERNLYKNTLGDKLVFEEINHTLQLSFRYSWNTSEAFGFVRQAELRDLSGSPRTIDMIDGLQNLLPSGAPLTALQTRSALVDAYKWNERVDESSLALYTMYAKLSDQAEPAESLLATAVFSLNGDDGQILLSSEQLMAFRQGKSIHEEPLRRGLRGSYLIHKTIQLSANESHEWMIVADIDKTHSDICELQQLLLHPTDLHHQVERSILSNQQDLIALMSGADAWQLTAAENTSVHHYANVLFNNMRGGVFENNYQLDKQDVIKTLRHTNRLIVDKHADLLADLPDTFEHSELMALVKASQDNQLVRLAYEYLPLTFGRRHGDPSRPWNHYEIKLKDEHGDRLLSYQGNWRDIFQNWEALALSYPQYIQSFLSKFVNASTIDGYNPYRITKDGIDWELLEPDDPWSNIGYWGDHQIIYLLKFLELADHYQRGDLLSLLEADCFSYANVPYELSGVEALFDNPKDTVTFNDETQRFTEARVKELGSDGRLLLDAHHEVYTVNLMEKILVPLLAKLSNLVLDGGIWLNTQRPEWNDANNAIVGNGLSMVTLYYMRRYVVFMQQLLANTSESESVSISTEVLDWMHSITTVLTDAEHFIQHNTVTPESRMAILMRLEDAAAHYRQTVYRQKGFSGKSLTNTAEIQCLLDKSRVVIDASIRNNQREDGLYNAYNILSYSKDRLTIDELYPMLEGQVAVLSSGLLTPDQSVALLEQLFASDMYRPDQRSFMLYPDRHLSTFMNKNHIPTERVEYNALLKTMINTGDKRIVLKDDLGNYHFNAAFENSGVLRKALKALHTDYPSLNDNDRQAIIDLYEEVFHHKAFTGRSGTMFGYEGLGCIYWHMVSKLLLAVQENYRAAWHADPTQQATQQLADFYYRVREGIGFNKTPLNYGAFPTDPYSHTPSHAGAQQPGMTGQVKEEVITRFGELGLEINSGCIEIHPSLLDRHEFLSHPVEFHYRTLQGNAQSIQIEAQELAFTYCQVPFIYRLGRSDEQGIKLWMEDGTTVSQTELVIAAKEANKLFGRTGEIGKIEVTVSEDQLR